MRRRPLHRAAAAGVADFLDAAVIVAAAEAAVVAVKAANAITVAVGVCRGGDLPGVVVLMTVEVSVLTAEAVEAVAFPRDVSGLGHDRRDGRTDGRVGGRAEDGAGLRGLAVAAGTAESRC